MNSLLCFVLHVQCALPPKDVPRQGIPGRRMGTSTRLEAIPKPVKPTKRVTRPRNRKG